MRGKGNSLTKWVSNGRITPAYAGKSAFFDHKAKHRQDHPRVCGEKV